jgi:hypothetical protein
MLSLFPSAICGSRFQPETRSHRHLRLSEGLARHLRGVSVGYGEGYLSIIKAFAYMHRANIATLVITGNHGLFGMDYNLQHYSLPHKNPTYIVPTGILPGCKVGDIITITKVGGNYKISVNRNTLFELIIENDVVHLHQCSYIDNTSRLSSVLINGVEHGKTILC